MNVWHQTVRTHNACHTSLQLLEQGPQLVLGQLVLLAYHSGHIPNTQNACDKPRRDRICGRWQSLVLVGWAGIFVCRLECNKTSGCYLQPRFMYNTYFVETTICFAGIYSRKGTLQWRSCQPSQKVDLWRHQLFTCGNNTIIYYVPIWPKAEHHQRCCIVFY